MAGSKQTALNIKERIKNFLKDQLKLELSDEKTLITNAVNSKAEFLGVDIGRLSSVKGEIKSFRNVRGHSQIVPTTPLILNAPIKKLIKILEERGVLR